MAPDDMARADTLAADDRTMTALRLSLTLVAMFVGSLGAALGLYAAAFMGVHGRYRPLSARPSSAERVGGVGRRRSLYCCRFLGHRAPNQTLRAQDRVTVDVATRTDIVTLPLNCDPPPGRGVFEPRLRLNRCRNARSPERSKCSFKRRPARLTRSKLASAAFAPHGLTTKR